MRRPIRASFWLVALLPATAGAQQTVRSLTFQSATLGHQARIQILLPASYDSTSSYPLLWLLHGFGGDDSSFLKLTQVERAAAPYPLIIVMPGAPRSFFVNSALKTTAAYETFITSELHEVIAQRFAADTTREAVAGASMGGYGAAMLALRYPNRYRFAGLVIPALSVPDSISAADSAFAPWAIPFVDSAFGYPPNVHRMTHDPFLLIRQAVASPAPYFYIVAAEGDEFPSFLGITREWVRSLQAANVPYEYHELPGHHDERMLDIALPGLLAHAWITLTSLR